MTLRLSDWFCGAGGSTQGAASVPGVEPVHAANHWAQAIETHAVNFPDVDHWKGDIRDVDVSKLPYAEIFWASPECTNWSQAKGRPQDYAVTDVALPGMEDPAPAEEVERSRALMEEVPLYLRAMALRGRPVLAGVVENVVDIRNWTDWGRWRAEVEAVGYKTRLIALNSMHAQATRTPRAPQSRDRLYLAYWHVSLGRDPDWDRWLRPSAWCPNCEEQVAAVQAWKRPGADMGRYRKQYVYRCPRTTCRGQQVEPSFLPAAAAIDWTLPGERIGDRARPLAEKTLARIEAGIRKYARPITLEATGNTFERRPGVRTWPADGVLTTQTTDPTKAVAVPMLVPAGGTWNDHASPVSAAMRARTTRDTEAVVVPPLLVPVEGRDGKQAGSALTAMRTQTGRNETGLLVAPMVVTRRDFDGGHEHRVRAASDALPALAASGNHQSVVVPPFLTTLRGGGSQQSAYTLDRALATVSANGNHHGLITPAQTMAAWAAVYGYDTGALRDHTLTPLPTQTTVEGDAVLTGDWPLPPVEDCLFRMLEPHEIHAGMAFVPDYIVLGNKRQRVRQLGNAVTPPVAEVLVSALVECITGEQIEGAA